MVKLLGIMFFVLLVGAHLADLQGNALDRPLSMFRDCQPQWIGYALFAVLIGIGAETTRTAWRLNCQVATLLYACFTGLLMLIAGTPSNDSIHLFGTGVVLLAMFVYFASLLYQCDSFFCLMIHLLMPSVMLMAARAGSGGIWEKSMIIYFMVATLVHQHVLARWLPPRQGVSGRRRRTRLVGRQFQVRILPAAPVQRPIFSNPAQRRRITSDAGLRSTPF